MQLLKGEDHISGVMVSVLASSAVGVGSSPDRVKRRTIELVFVAFPLSTLIFNQIMIIRSTLH
jgi:hypothetical protein